jgi:hypothetical protein
MFFLVSFIAMLDFHIPHLQNNPGKGKQNLLSFEIIMYCTLLLPYVATQLSLASWNVFLVPNPLSTK